MTKLGVRSYGFGFNGKEKLNEAYGEGNAYDYGARMYDPRIGRWMAMDPKASDFPFSSPYVAFNNNPIFYADPDGKSPWPPSPFNAYERGDKFYAGYSSTGDRKWKNNALNLYSSGVGLLPGIVGGVGSVAVDLISGDYASAGKGAVLEGTEQTFKAVGNAIEADNVIGENKTFLKKVFSEAPIKVVTGIGILNDINTFMTEYNSAGTNKEALQDLTVTALVAHLGAQIEPTPTTTLVSGLNGSKGFYSMFNTKEDFQNALDATYYLISQATKQYDLTNETDKGLAEQYIQSADFGRDLRKTIKDKANENNKPGK